MGTTGVAMTAAETRADLLKQFEYQNERGFSKVLAHAKGRGGFWILREVEYSFNGEHFPAHTTATFIFMESAGGMTYYKEIDIDCAPYAYDCPKTWLTRIQPSGKDGESWLEKAKAHHANQKKIVPGLKIIYDGKVFEVVELWSRGKWIVRDPHGTRYSMKSSTIQESKVAEEIAA